MGQWQKFFHLRKKSCIRYKMWFTRDVQFNKSHQLTI